MTKFKGEKEKWNNGIMEDWNNGLLTAFFPCIIPPFRHSIIRELYLDFDI